MSCFGSVFSMSVSAILWYVGLIPIIGFIIYCVWMVFGVGGSSKHADILLVLYFVLLLYSRSLSLLVPFPFNPDEAQYVAQAMLFFEGPIPWTHVDTTTGGPLGTYAIMIPSLLGLSPSYFMARIIAISLIWGSCFYGYRTVRLFLPDSWAAVVVLPPVLFWAFAVNRDYIHYSSELVPILLLSASFYYLVSAYTEGERFSRLLVSIALASMVPFAKLQAVVIAFPIAIIGVLACLCKNGVRGFVRRLPWIVLSGLGLPAMILLPVCLSGGWMDFVKSYLALGVRYGASDGVFWIFVRNALLDSPSVFIAGAAHLAIIAVFVGWAIGCAWSPERRVFAREWMRRVFTWPMVPAIIVFLAAAYAIAKPGTGFSHYWQLIMIPSSVIGGLFVARMDMQDYPFFSKLPTLGLLGTFVYSTLWYEFVVFNSNVFDPNNYYGEDVHVAAVVSFIDKEKQPDDRMTVWGWMPDLYVKTGLVSGTREVSTHMAVTGAERAFEMIEISGEMKAYYQDRFMRDIKRSRPAFVVDAWYPGSFAFEDRSYSPESFPSFWSFLGDHYDLVLDTSSADIEGMRVWKYRSIARDGTNRSFSGSSVLDQDLVDVASVHQAQKG